MLGKFSLSHSFKGAGAMDEKWHFEFLSIMVAKDASLRLGSPTECMPVQLDVFTLPVLANGIVVSIPRYS
jgi:hypothetical protein